MSKKKLAENWQAKALQLHKDLQREPMSPLVRSNIRSNFRTDGLLAAFTKDGIEIEEFGIKTPLRAEAKAKYLLAIEEIDQLMKAGVDVVNDPTYEIAQRKADDALLGWIGR